MSTIDKPDKARGFVTLDSIVREMIMDIGDTLARYEQFLGFCLRGFKKYAMDGVSGVNVKTVELSLTAWKAISLPVDFMKALTIGVRINGTIYAFTCDETIALQFDGGTEDGSPIANIPYNGTDLPVDPTNTIPYYFLGWDGGDTGQLYGLAVKGTHGYFRLNKERNEIQFAATTPADTIIYLEYNSTSYVPGKATVVHDFASDQIRLYGHWQRLMLSKSASRAEVADMRREYYAEVQRTNSRDCTLTIEDIQEVARNAYKLSPGF